MRDAAARLPNGEGTRAEICELLKDSQFLAPDVTSAQVGYMLPFFLLTYSGRHCSVHFTFTCLEPFFTVTVAFSVVFFFIHFVRVLKGFHLPPR